MTAFDELTAQISATAAPWVARQTPHSQLSDEQKQRLLGVVVNQSDLAAAMTVTRAQGANLTFATAIDWRNHNGNHVTPVKDQGGCGSCVSFGTISVVEALASIETGRTLDLSEADLHFCSDHGASCNGWWPTDAFKALQSRGTPDEDCFPYSSAFDAGNPACKIGPNRDARAVHVTESTTLNSIAERKNWLSTVGPCAAVFRVFDDFFSYGGGVYRHVTGVEQGTHCVAVVGYSDADQCWICKNSWGTSFGEQGFFRIGYGQAGIDSEFPFWTARGVQIPATKLAQAMWVHGHSLQIESPTSLARVWRAGFYAEVEGNPNTDNWFHFAIPTKVIVNDNRLRVGSVMLLFETLSPDAIVRDVHIYDGDTKIAVHNGVNLSGNAGFVRFDVPDHPSIKWGLGITVGVHFGDSSSSRVMRFKSAGCDFIA